MNSEYRMTKITKDTIRDARNNAKTWKLELLQKYDFNSDDIYIVVEGKDDDSFYTIMFNRNNWLSNRFRIIIADNRKGVIDTYKMIDWSVYSKKRIYFCVDRDLSDFTEESTPKLKNFYVTDDYSIENYVCKSESLLDILRLLYKIDGAEDSYCSNILSLYDAALQIFEEKMLTIMGIIIFWRTKGINCELNNLNKGSYYTIEQCVFKIQQDYIEKTDFIQNVYKICCVKFDEKHLKEIQNNEDKLRKKWIIHKYVRGKYLITFYLRFITSAVEYWNSSNPKKRAKPITGISESNAIQIMSGYIKTPKSLECFMRSIVKANTSLLRRIFNHKGLDIPLLLI